VSEADDRPEALAAVELLFRYTAAVCRRAGLEHEAQLLRRCKIDPEARFSCALRSLGACETTARLRWGAGMMGGRDPAGLAVELLVLCSAAVVAFQASPGEPLFPWVEGLLIRARRRAHGRYPDLVLPA